MAPVGDPSVKGDDGFQWAVRPGLYPYALGLATMVAVEPVVKARYLSIAQWLREFSAWPEGRRTAWQRHRLAGILDHAGTHVPFYRDLLGGRPGAALTDLPVVDKEQVRRDMGSFLSAGWETVPHITKATGGTTGDPWRYPLDKRAWAQIYGASLHFREQVGYRYGERIVLLGSPQSLLPGGSGWKAGMRARLERRVYAAAGLDVDHVSSLARARQAGDLRGAMWYGYASTVAAMADAVAREGLEIHPPRAIITSSEMLWPAWRRRIEEAFGVGVYDEYGCNDGGVLAQTCGVGRFHVAENVSIIEVLDGDKPCPPGVEGDIVVTNLHARVLPFLRYRVGDRVVLGEGPCPCGRAGVAFTRVAGRHGDRLRLPCGRELSARAFGPVFEQASIRHVRRWQVVQTAIDRVVIRLDVEPGFTAAEAEAVQRSFRDRCGDDVMITLSTSEPIELTDAGKHRVVIRASE